MRFSGSKILWGWMVVLQLCLASLWAQTNVPRAQLKTGLESPPLPQPAKPPVDFFRELLAMTLAERQQALSDRLPETRRQILAKVREYESLKPNVRELRLRATELRWYLLPLMRISPTNRPAQLSIIPAEIRTLVDSRLREWDLLPPDVQKDFLAREATIRLFTQIQAATNSPPIPPPIPSPNIEDFKRIPEEQRRILIERWDRFLGLSDQEKERTLQTLSVQERAQIEKTLRKFEDLTPAQRRDCVRSFEIFKQMSRTEQQEFLKNAGKWSAMKPEQRKQWQDLVASAPLVPPALINRAPKPPLPVIPKPKTNKNGYTATNN